MARGLFNIVSVVNNGGIPPRYTLTVSSTSGILTGDHVGARLPGADPTPAGLYLVVSVPGPSTLVIEDSLTEGETGTFGAPDAGRQAGYGTPEAFVGLTQLPFRSPGWDAAVRRNNALVDPIGTIGPTGPTGPTGATGPVTDLGTILSTGNATSGTNILVSTGDEVQGQTDLTLRANSGDVIVEGDLVVNGTTTTISTTNTAIADQLIILSSGAGSGVHGGLAFERGATGDDALIHWNETNDRFEFGLFDTTAGTTAPGGALGTFVDIQANQITGTNFIGTTADFNTVGITSNGIQLGSAERIEWRNDPAYDGGSSDLFMYRTSPGNLVVDNDGALGLAAIRTGVIESKEIRVRPGSPGGGAISWWVDTNNNATIMRSDWELGWGSDTDVIYGDLDTILSRSADGVLRVTGGIAGTNPLDPCIEIYDQADGFSTFLTQSSANGRLSVGSTRGAANGRLEFAEAVTTTADFFWREGGTPEFAMNSSARITWSSSAIAGGAGGTADLTISRRGVGQLQVGNASDAESGALYCNSYSTTTSGVARTLLGPSRLTLRNTAAVQWTNDGTTTGTVDVELIRDGVGTLKLYDPSMTADVSFRLYTAGGADSAELTGFQAGVMSIDDPANGSNAALRLGNAAGGNGNDVFITNNGSGIIQIGNVAGATNGSIEASSITLTNFLSLTDTDELRLGTGDDLTIQWSGAIQASGHAGIIGVNSTGITAASGNIIITALANTGNDHDHGPSSDPTLFIHSNTNPDTANDEWISFSHDKTDANINIGSGNLNLNASPGVVETDTSILGPNGLVGAPSYSFTNTTNSGMYYTGSDVALAHNGVAALRLASTHSLFTGALRVGATDATSAGDFSAGVTSGNRMFWSAGAGFLQLFNVSSGTGEKIGLYLQAENSGGPGGAGMATNITFALETFPGGAEAVGEITTELQTDNAAGSNYANMIFSVDRNGTSTEVLRLGNSEDSTGSARLEVPSEGFIFNLDTELFRVSESVVGIRGTDPIGGIAPELRIYAADRINYGSISSIGAGWLNFNAAGTAKFTTTPGFVRSVVLHHCQASLTIPAGQNIRFGTFLSEDTFLLRESEAIIALQGDAGTGATEPEFRVYDVDQNEYIGIRNSGTIAQVITDKVNMQLHIDGSARLQITPTATTFGATITTITASGAALRVANGSSTAPAYSFASETNMGLYKLSASFIAIATGGSARSSWSSVGLGLGIHSLFWGPGISSNDTELLRISEAVLALQGNGGTSPDPTFRVYNTGDTQYIGYTGLLAAPDSVTPTLSNLPTGGTASQVGWIELDIDGTTSWVPYWQ